MSLIHLSDYFKTDDWECFLMIRDYPAALDLAEEYAVENMIVLERGMSVKEEVARINQLIQIENIDLLLFEITGEPPLYEYKGLEDRVVKACVSFDKRILADMDIVINWDVEAEKIFGKERHQETRYLLGPEFVILPMTFDFSQILKRKYRSSPASLLVLMGGADELDFTGKVVDTLVQAEVQLELIIVIGSGYTHRERLESSLKNSTLEYTIRHNISNMIDAYMNCDVAIGAGGLTASELVASRTPAVLIATYDHQISRCRFFDKKGWAKYLGFRDYDEGELLEAVLNPSPPEPGTFFQPKSILEACNEIIRQ